MWAGRDYFPLGKAYDQAFCNRYEETKRLVGNVQSGKHTLLAAPRRYGKSSLAEKAMLKSSLPHANADFHLAVDEEDVAILLIKAVSYLIGKALGPVDKLVHSIKQYVKHLNPKLSIDTDELRLEITSNVESTPSINITEALLLLERLLAEKKKQAVLFLNEFQMIGLIAKGGGVEGAIRHAAQEMKCLTIIFSGSNRALLGMMFENEARPLYKLCRKIILERISCEHYETHLNKIAQKTWHKPLSKDVFEMIVHLTERHPYYLNYLCDELWLMCSSLPTVRAVKQAWLRVLEEERSDLLKEFFELSNGQRRLLIHVANACNDALLSKEVSLKLNMPISSISKSINVLIEKDILDKRDGQYYVLNPALRSLLNIE